MIKLVACDIDGTLLHGDDTRINPKIFEKIKLLKQKGILFCAASGRQYINLQRLFTPVADEIYYSCENGAVVFGPGNPGPLLGKTVMDRDLVRKLSQEIMDQPNCEVLFSGAYMCYLWPKKPDTLELISPFVDKLITVGSIDEITEDFVKVSAYCRDGAAKYERMWGPVWSSHCNVAIGGEKWLDFTLSDKGVGIATVCRALGIHPSEVMAIGDNYNDLPMLKLVGSPVIMENAVPELRNMFTRKCRDVESVLDELLNT
ncbi:MAG: HAD family phosphatase [Clostridiaceae bacterium]|nr:HAD family phosphatase [Clostridiaceae bacterium]